MMKLIIASNIVVWSLSSVFLLLPSINNAFLLQSPITKKCSSNNINNAISPPVAAGGDPKVDGNLYPFDQAETTAELLASLWNQITHVASMNKGDTYTIKYPNMAEKFTPSYVNRLMGHLDNCKDVCDHFGVRTNLLPYVQQGKVLGFTAKSYSGPESSFEDMQFNYDPFWDDADIGDYTGVDEEEDGVNPSKYPDIVNKIPKDDDEIISITRSWVAKFMSDMGVCPFTSGADLAGLPMGKVYYCVDRCSGFEETYGQYWKEVVRVEQSNEKDLSTTLMVCPEFCMDNVEQFESFSNTLTQSLTGINMEAVLQLVFFHPDWAFRDGGDRVGAAANYARRSPWPMINILRTEQVRSAQKSIPTGLVYTQNEKTLTKVGVDRLETMLRLRNWGDIADVKVDRRDREALRVAQDFQATGEVKSMDLSFENDATPAANKVNKKEQVEQGNLLNVIQQALGKRLGLNGENGEFTQLSGPETSATIMASDFLLEELNSIMEQKKEQQCPFSSS